MYFLQKEEISKKVTSSWPIPLFLKSCVFKLSIKKMWVKIVPGTLWSRKSETQVSYCLKSSVESFAIVPFHYWILTIKYALSFFKCTSLFHPIVPFGYFGIVEYILKRITAFYGTKYSIYSQVCQIWNWKQAYFRFRNKRRGTLINFQRLRAY